MVLSTRIIKAIDTAVTQIASAFQTPTLAMYARGKAGLWGPYDIPGTVGNCVRVGFAVAAVGIGVS
jgi:ADP-heptose:LPS heptosyltransferase